MKRFIPERLALNGVLSILSLMVLFHLLVLTGVLPFTVVWGGQMTGRQQMLRMESLSVAVNLLMLAVVAARAGYLGGRIPPTALTIALWVMTVLFLLNTLGNLLSQNTLERLVFTPLTAALCVLCLRLAVQKCPAPVRK